MVFEFPRCEVVPLPEHQVSFRIDGVERTRWHYGQEYPRPFFYPLLGPSQIPLTRMGHPGAPDHEHHRSIWFAHHKVLGIDFWSDRTPARIQQIDWIAYQDGPDAAVMGVQLGWYDGHDPKPLLTQETVASVSPGPDGETLFEIQFSLRPEAASLEFGQTNFGFFAVRVAKSLSERFGGGQLTNSEGATGEPAIFGKTARWMDYSGPVRGDVNEGITFFDHPENPGFPNAWHVRQDGWMGASACFSGPRETTRAAPLTLRYLLHAHAGSYDADRAKSVADEFVGKKGFEVRRSEESHIRYAVIRKS